jgi:hypothetical protein
MGTHLPACRTRCGTEEDSFVSVPSGFADVVEYSSVNVGTATGSRLFLALAIAARTGFDDFVVPDFGDFGVAGFGVVGSAWAGAATATTPTPDIKVTKALARARRLRGTGCDIETP